MAKVLRRTGKVAANTRLTDRLAFMDVAIPDIPKLIQPGQFVHMRLPGMDEHPLRRPFSIMSVDLEASTMRILYQAVGFGSERMLGFEPGVALDVMGPIGTPWKAPEGTSRALLVVGGVGAAPLAMHCQELVSAGVSVQVVMGAQTADALVARDAYMQILGFEPLCATDDGTYGHHGFVTALVEQEMAKGGYDYVACCGPEPMMRIVSKVTLDAGVPTYVSMEKRMACGIGACLSCVVQTKEGNRRACVDGPIFDASEVIWQ